MRLSVRLPMSLVAAAVLVLNLADALFTLIYVRLGVAREGNPLMERALGGSAIDFMIIKLSLVSLCVLLLVHLRERHAAGRAPAFALVGAALAYASLLAYHLTAVRALL